MTWAASLECHPPSTLEPVDLARIIADRLLKPLLLPVACLCLLPVAGAATGSGLLDEILRAADQGECIEGVTFRMIQQQGPAEAGIIVKTALVALARREQQQRSLGCAGDIAAQAIAAGADPDQVLEATAAGL